MLTKRIIACLDVRDGRVVKGVQFRNHRDMGDILELSQRYADEGVDELVFYDITASSDGRVVDKGWVNKVARRINIPFCVAGGIRSVDDARAILNDSADKISVNSPAWSAPNSSPSLPRRSERNASLSESTAGWKRMMPVSRNMLFINILGMKRKTISSTRDTVAWAREAQRRGAGEIVLNCMNNDGVKRGYDLDQLALVREAVSVPVIASGGAGDYEHFADLFQKTGIDGGLAASVFHSGQIPVPDLKHYLRQRDIKVRI